MTIDMQMQETWSKSDDGVYQPVQAWFKAEILQTFDFGWCHSSARWTTSQQIEERKPQNSQLHPNARTDRAL